MALVAGYGSSSEEEDEPTFEEKKEISESKVVKENGSEDEPEKSKFDDQFSDEEEDFLTSNGSVDPDNFQDTVIPGVSSTRNFFDSLPSIKPNKIGEKSPEEIQTEQIQKSKLEEEKVEEVELTEAEKRLREEAKNEKLEFLAKKNKKRKGPVKISVPSLSQFDNEDLDEDPTKALRRPTTTNQSGSSSSKKASMLLSMLPQPKNAATAVSAAAPAKLSGVRSLVPDSVKRPPVKRPVQPSTSRPAVKKAKAAHSDDEDDDENPTSFFTLTSEKVEPADLSKEDFTSKSLKKVNAAAQLPAEVERRFEAESMVGPSRPSAMDYATASTSSLPEPEDLMANTEAINRLAGKHAVKTGQNADIMEVDQVDLKASAREWMVKALSEDDAGKPGPRNNIKGTTKRKHQITYLAAMAKENEHKLKEEWAKGAANRRAASNKYGF